MMLHATFNDVMSSLPEFTLKGTELAGDPVLLETLFIFRITSAGELNRRRGHSVGAEAGQGDYNQLTDEQKIELASATTIWEKFLTQVIEYVHERSLTPSNSSMRQPYESQSFSGGVHEVHHDVDVYAGTCPTMARGPTAGATYFIKTRGTTGSRCS